MDLIKYDMTDIWAVAGDVVAPTSAKVRAGWGVEVVPRQWWNWFENRQDQNIAYMLQKGFPEWDATTEYIINKSYVQRSGIVYKATATSTNSDPVALTSWVRAFANYTVAGNALGAVTPAANVLPYFTSTTAAATTSLTAFARTLLDDADAATMRTTIGAQALNANLTALSGVTPVVNGLPYFTSTTAMGIANLTAFARTILDDADAATVRATLGLGTAAVATLTVGNNDGTAGRVNTVGDYGWGVSVANGLTAMDPPSNGSAGDLNLATTAGVYRISTGNVNVPAGFGQGALMITLIWNGGTGAQIITQNGSSAMRGGSNLNTTGTWTTWATTWNSSNLVKTASVTDTTAGSMLKVGDFGLGGDAPTVTDLNAINASGFYKGLSSAANVPVASAWVCLHSNYNTGGAGQVFFNLPTGDIWTRTQNSTTSWTAWAKSITTANQQTVIDLAATAAATSAANLYLPKTGGTLTNSLVIDNPTSGNMSLEIGSKLRANTPFLDFNSSAGGTDYDSRIIASGGSTTLGQGVLGYFAGGGHNFNGLITANSGVAGNLTGNVSGVLTGSVSSSTTGVTAPAGNNSTLLATTAFVAAALTAASTGYAASGANSDITSLSGLTTPLSVAQGGTGTNASTGTGSMVKAVSPALTGTPTAPTAATTTNNTQLATTAFVQAAAYTKTNVVGTVSQASGVPTGAVLEKGTNANGNYVKFADGTLICYMNRNSSISYGSVYPFAGGTTYYATDTWTYPVTFVSGSIPATNCTVTVGGRIVWSGLLGSTATNTQYYLLQSTNETAASSVLYTAIGRWY